MKVSQNSEQTLVVELEGDKKMVIMYYKKTDELSVSFINGKRNIKEHQNRSDGYSGTSFTKASTS